MADAPILSWEDLGLQQGGRWLFRALDLNVGPRDRLALIGRNGVGKTTLFRLVANQIEADRGKRSIQPGTRVVLLEQEPDISGYATLMDFALAGADAPQRHEVEAIAGQLGIDMARPAATASGGERPPAPARPRAGAGSGPAAARRADQPPRPRGDRLARIVAQTATRARSSRSATTAPSSSG
jgi:energy-coupling factor transporter ATP-binding protein EcfA2